MKKLTQMDLYVLELLEPKPMTISEIYRIAQINLAKVDKSIDKLVNLGRVKFENKKYFLVQVR